MTFQGMPLATVLQALGVAAAAVTLLYLLKLRRRQVTVPFSPLWAKLLAESESRALLQRLKRLLSWLLAIAFAAAVAVAAGDPRAQEATEDARSWVVLLDASASMRATDGSPTRFDDARAHAMAVVDSLRAGDAAMVVQVDADVTPLTPFTGDRRSLAAAIAEAAPGESAADLHRALRFADAALHGRTGGGIVAISDLAGRPPPAERAPGAAPLHWAPVGQRGDNVGILGFNARPYRANRRQFEVFLRVRNDGDQPAKCRVSISADGVLTEVLPLDVPAGGTVDRFFPDLVVEGRRLMARLEVREGPANLLPTDDVAYALLPESAPLRVALVSGQGGNLFLEAAMLLDDNIEVINVAADALSDVDPPPDAWVFDRVAPALRPPGPALFIDPPAQGAPWPPTGRVVADGLVRVKADHALGRWLGVPDLGEPEASRIQVRPGDSVILRAGDLPLVVARDGDPRTVQWTFDPLTSDLPLKSAFPLLLMHTFEWFARTEEAERSSWPVGQAWRVPLRTEATTATVTAPGGGQRVAPVADGRVRVRGRRAGFHELSAQGAESVVVAASLQDPQESSIAPAQDRVTLARASPAPLRTAAAGGRPIWLLLGLFAVAWLALEWGSFHRRWTV